MSHITSVLLDQYVDRAEYLFFLILQIYIKVSAASSQIDEQPSRFSIGTLSPEAYYVILTNNISVTFLRFHLQALGVVMASLTHLAIGTIVGLPGVTLPQLTDPNTEDIFLDTAQVALFGESLTVKS